MSRALHIFGLLLLLAPPVISYAGCPAICTLEPTALLRRTPQQGCKLVAEAPAPVKITFTGVNSRCISSAITIDRRLEDVWKVLTDYDNLANVVPNLVVSRRVPHPSGGIRVFQEGAQNVVGLDFRASVTMDMQELIARGDSQQRRLTFDLHDSFMFERFSGARRSPHLSCVLVEGLHSLATLCSMRTPCARTARMIRCAGDWRLKGNGAGGKDTTELSYSVNIQPKGVVPVPAIEWRIREDVPANLRGLKRAVEQLPPRRGLLGR